MLSGIMHAVCFLFYFPSLMAGSSSSFAIFFVSIASCPLSLFVCRLIQCHIFSFFSTFFFIFSRVANLLATGTTNSQVVIWDVESSVPTKPGMCFLLFISFFLCSFCSAVVVVFMVGVFRVFLFFSYKNALQIHSLLSLLLCVIRLCNLLSFSYVEL